MAKYINFLGMLGEVIGKTLGYRSLRGNKDMGHEKTINAKKLHSCPCKSALESRFQSSQGKPLSVQRS